MKLPCFRALLGRHWVLFLLTACVASTSLAAGKGEQDASSEHEALFLESRFPSATTCKGCHPDHYREWSVSAHAYAQMSPVFNAMHGTILEITNGTNGDFCIRCHTPVGMNLGEKEFMSNIDRNPTSREGITCVVCHRLKNEYGKVSGRLAITEADIFGTVYGTKGDAELKRVIESDEYAVNADPTRGGRNIHATAKRLDQIDKPGFCGTCHDVNLVNGFRLEEAFSEYKASPASSERTSCQDCHMGKEPGKPSGYATGPAAKVGGVPTTPRKRTNHMFAGPDYSIIHPGIFPHNVDAAALASIREWLTFDVGAGWGTDAFEDTVSSTYPFPPRWGSADDRYDARDILNANQQLLKEIAVQRKQVLRAGYEIGDIRVERASEKGVAFRVEFKNVTNGHNVPTGFDAERVVFLRVTVRDASGQVVYESGDLDPNGDLRDQHSLSVHAGELPLDRHLFSVQSKFLTRMVRGGEREQVLALNFSPDPLPFLRPSTRPTVLLSRPLGARKHRVTIRPLSSQWASYEVGRSALAGTNGPYRATVQIIAGMVPVNLIHEISEVGFDYDMSERQIANAVVAGHIVVDEREVELSATR